MKDTKDYYVYMLYEEMDNGAEKPYYIGKGHKTRMTDHFMPCFYNNKKTPMYCKIKSLVKKGKELKAKKIYVNLTEEKAYSLESEKIKEIGTHYHSEYPGPLRNMNLGGTGGSSPSQEVRDKISKANKGRLCGEKNHNYGKDCKGDKNWFYGKHHDINTRARMRRNYLIWDKEMDTTEKVTDIYSYFNNKGYSKSQVQRISMFFKKGFLYDTRFIGIKLRKEEYNFTRDELLNYMELLKYNTFSILNEVSNSKKTLYKHTGIYGQMSDLKSAIYSDYFGLTNKIIFR